MIVEGGEHLVPTSRRHAQHRLGNPQRGVVVELPLVGQGADGHDRQFFGVASPVLAGGTEVGQAIGQAP